MSVIFTSEVQMTSIICSECGAIFALSGHYISERKADHKGFYCPNGHRQYFSGKSEAEKLRDQVIAKQQRLDQAEAEIRWQKEQRQATERRLAAHRGVATKLRKRASKGACPCCMKKFPDMEKHMAENHPHYAAMWMARRTKPNEH